jgi:glycosyltransferase involved in cell wall biosynthesis
VGNDTVKIFVCVCTCNRPKLLGRLLDALKPAELGDIDGIDVELIVVDNCPTGEAKATCLPAAPSLPVPLHFVEEPERGISLARNRAVDEGLRRGADFIAFIDDDDVPEPDWLVHLIEKQRQTQAAIVFGSWRPVFGSDNPDWVMQLRHFGKSDNRLRNRYGVELPSRAASCNVLIARDIIEQLIAEGPVFCPEFSFIGGEDIDFFIRAVKRGMKFSIAEKSIINKTFADGRLTAWGVVKLAFRLGSGPMHLAIKHCTRAEIRYRRRKALKVVVVEFLCLPLHIYSKARSMNHIYNISKSLGTIYSYAGGQFRYYR